MWACAERKIKEKTKQNNSNIFTVSQRWHKFWQYFPTRLNTRNRDLRGDVQQSLCRYTTSCDASEVFFYWTFDWSVLRDILSVKFQLSVGLFLLNLSLLLQTFLAAELENILSHSFKWSWEKAVFYFFLTASWFFTLNTLNLPLIDLHPDIQSPQRASILRPKNTNKKSISVTKPSSPPLHSVRFDTKGNSVNHWSLTSHLCDGS